jgi:hypothetical protein
MDIFKRDSELLFFFVFIFVGDLAADGLKYYDVLEGKGAAAEKGMTVQVNLLETETNLFLPLSLKLMFSRAFPFVGAF